jgi:hypothetical protein
MYFRCHYHPSYLFDPFFHYIAIAIAIVIAIVIVIDHISLAMDFLLKMKVTKIILNEALP